MQRYVFITALKFYLQGFRQRGMGDKPPPTSNDSMGSLNLIFLGNFFSSFENFKITLRVILRHLEAELSIPRCLKLIRG
jgi:hypothetical protein